MVNLFEIFNNFYNLSNKLDLIHGSYCGPGSSLEYTRNIQIELPALITKYSIKSMFDGGCGDRNWIKQVDLPCCYLGGDVSKDFVTMFPDQIIKHEITSDPIPEVDLILLRDVAIHLSNRDRYKLLQNLSKSPAKFVLMTQCETDVNKDVDYSVFPFSYVNWMIEPWHLPKPLEKIVEILPEKSLSLWTIEQIKTAVNQIDFYNNLD